MSKPDKQARSRDEKGRFVPGQSGNPKGRPPRQTLTESLVERLDDPCPNDKKGRTWREVIVNATLLNAIGGKPAALQEVWNRSDGKVKNNLEHTGPGGGPIQVAQKRVEDYGKVLEGLAGLSQGSSAGEPVDSSQPD